jgi:hypothetical protein
MLIVVVPPELQRFVDSIRAERLRELIDWCDKGVLYHSQWLGVVGPDHETGARALELTQRLVGVGLAEMVGDIPLIGRRYSHQSIVALLAKYSRILGEELEKLERVLAQDPSRTPEPTATSEAIRADRSPLFPKGVPEDSDLVDLVTRLDAAKGSGKSWNGVARELLGDERRSQSLLRQIRRMRLDGRVNL